MKIAHIIATFPPHIGGMGEVCFNEAKLLSERGHNITVFALRYPKTTYQDESFPFRVIRLHTIVRSGDAGWVPNLFHKLRRFDLIHLHYPFYGGAEWVWLARLLNKQRYVITFHMQAQTTGWVKPLIQQLYDFLFTRTILKGALKIIAVEPHHFEYVTSKFHIPVDQWAPLFNGVDTDFFRPSQNKDASFLEINELKDKKIILFVGNLLPFKRLDLLIEAFNKLNDARAILVVVGGGYRIKLYRDLVEKLGLKERVIFMGPCFDKERLVDYYNNAWCTVVASDRGESFSLVMSEAFACGCPVVVSDIPGLKQRVHEGVDGFIFKSGDVQSLTQSLERALSLSQEERKNMGEYGRKKMIENYSWNTHVNKLERIYKEAISKIKK